MSLIVRILLPVVLVAATGALGVAWLAKISVDSSTEQSASANVSLDFVSRTAGITEELSNAKAELQSVLDMTRLMDVDQVWKSVSTHVDAIQTDLAWMSANTDNGDLLSVLEVVGQHVQAWENDAGILLGQIPSKEIPTSEKIARAERLLVLMLAQITDTVQLNAEESRIAASQAFRGAVTNTTLILAVGLILAFVIAWISAQRVTRQISALATKLYSLADKGKQENPSERNVLTILQQAVISLEAALEERSALEEAARKAEEEQLEMTKREQVRAEAEKERAAQERTEALEREAKQKKRAEQSAELEQEIAHVVSSARNGALDVRIAQSFEEQSMRDVAAGINALLDTVAGSIKQAQETQRRLAQGDLSARFEGDHKGIFGALQTDINQTAEQFQDAMYEIASSSRSIFEDASGISNAASSLAKRTEQTAARSEMTTGIVNRIAEAAVQMSENATKSNELVTSSLDDVKLSESSMQQAMGTMDEIAKFSKEISAVVKIINDISFQTNLLALNAGVEAARAGSAGSGFAVVASEVRSLAQRSADSAAEIEQLIGRSSAHVDKGVDVVQKTADALRVVSTSVSEISEHVFKIKQEARSQSEELVQVQESLGELDKDTQSNAAMFEETTAASHSLTESANALAKLAGRFDSGRTEFDTSQRLSA